MFRGLSKLKSERTGSNGSIDSRRISSGKSELAITAPKRIVRALYPYTAQHDDELSFNKNDFFYVNEEAAGEWYIASDPQKNVKGLVPQSYFEVIQRQDPQAVPVSQARRAHSRSTSAVSGSSFLEGDRSSRGLQHKQTNSQSSQASSNRRASLAIYGFVLYDFQAERNDELTVAAGESIVIVAQSTEEWFVAKPIGRLGGPGLIPVSYVEIREVGSDQPLLDVPDAIRRANLPQVDEWKRKLAEYKASSIPLGRFGTSSEQAQQQGGAGGHARSASAAQSARSHHSTLSNVSNPARTSHPYGHHKGPSVQSTGGGLEPFSQHRSEAYVISATVDRFAINGGRYWYLVKVEMSNGKHRNLCRFYQDFYDFQIKLLEQFPEEAGRTGKTRTLPFMPGPLTLVTHTVSTQRRANLDDYVRDLIRMPPHVSQSPLVLKLFAVRPGDVESNEPTQTLPQPPEDDPEQQYSGDIPAFPGGPRPDELSSSGGDSNAYKKNSSDGNTSDSLGTGAPPNTSIDGLSRLPTNDPYSPWTYNEDNKNAEHNDSQYGQNTLKIKVFAGSNVIAIKVPVDVPFSEIYDKIATRLSMPTPQLYTTPECDGEPVNNAAKFARALNGGTKISLHLGN